MAKFDPDEIADHAATQAAALTISWLRENLRRELSNALKDIYWSLWWDLFSYLYKANWVRLLAGAMTLISALSLWIHEAAK